MLERGIGQGESASSLILTAMCDILLDFKNKQLHSNEAGFNYSDQINDFADDLVTIMEGKNTVDMQMI
jgi:hypothetical protein